jgi:hypothetical protein
VKDPTDLLHWPEVPPDQRPKKLFHSGLIKPDIDKVLREKGWDPVDVRLISNITDDDRRAALKAWLEGIRFGTIEVDPRNAKWMELETKVYEIHKGVATKIDKDEDSDKTVDDVLSFGNSKQFSTPDDIKKKRSKKIKGRRTEEARNAPDQEEV